MADLQCYLRCLVDVRNGPYDFFGRRMYPVRKIVVMHNSGRNPIVLLGRLKFLLLVQHCCIHDVQHASTREEGTGPVQGVMLTCRHSVSQTTSRFAQRGTREGWGRQWDGGTVQREGRKRTGPWVDRPGRGMECGSAH